MKSTSPAQSIPHPLVLPPLTKATIQRAREGVVYARSDRTNQAIAEALQSAEVLACSGSQDKISGEVRRKVLRTLIHILFQIKVEFPERIPETPALIAANHLNHIDPFLLLSELPANPFYHILGDARTLYNNWWKRLFMRLAKGVIPLERIWKEEIAVISGAKAGREDLTQLADDIQQYVPQGNSIETLRRLNHIVQGIFACGDGIILFPEGRLGSVEGELQLPLKRGAAIYALRSGTPIVPVALIGSQDLYLRKELTLRFGEALIFPQSHRPKSKEIQAVLDELQAAMVALFPKDYHEPEEPKLLRHLLNRIFW